MTAARVWLGMHARNGEDAGWCLRYSMCMPRVRCHWALLGQTRAALRNVAPEAYALVTTHLSEYYAGGVAPDALRLYAGVTKAESHFYDDQRPQTWPAVLETVCVAHPEIALPGSLDPATQAWMVGYLVHLLTDIAYWRHVLSHLPPFPEQAELHHGAWLVADHLVTISDAERQVDVEGVRYDMAPPWVEEAAVRRLLNRLASHILPPDNMWAVELAYARRPDIAARPDDDLLRERLPTWESSLAQIRTALDERVWNAFQVDAAQGAVETVSAYLGRGQLAGGRKRTVSREQRRPFEGAGTVIQKEVTHLHSPR
jgi:hypothetical protein